MSINISQLKNNLNQVQMENYEKAGSNVAASFGNAEDDLMQIYTATDDATIKSIASRLGINVEKKSGTELLESTQTVAKLKYEKASRTYSMFIKIMENAHQMLMNIINKIG